MNLTELQDVTKLMADYTEALRVIEQQREAINELTAKHDRAKRVLESLYIVEQPNGEWVNQTL